MKGQRKGNGKMMIFTEKLTMTITKPGSGS